ncbi:MAG: hypothetical protein HYY63_03460 [Elusimicrobia bacterium]|nr:hypothetical protein [Elusimicrobiota bacterium]
MGIESLLKEKIVHSLRIEEVVPLSKEMWEDRIVPLLFELERGEGVKKITLQSGREKILCVGNEPDFFSTLSLGTEKTIGEPQVSLYVFNRITDLSTLRRLKDFPDETERSELESTWVGECPDPRSLLVINPSQTFSFHE